MAIKKVMIGPFGPYLYDDSKVIADTDFAGANYAGVITTGAVIGTPVSSGGGYSGTVTLVHSIRNNAGTIEYRNFSLTVVSGLITAVGSPGSWTTA